MVAVLSQPPGTCKLDRCCYEGIQKQVSQVCVLAAIMPAMVNAANWTLDKGVSVSEVLTDNENLEEDNTDAALITSVTPI